jgi:hypothetical protein
MSSPHLSVSRLEAGLRWAARLLGAGLVGLVVIIFIGEGFNPLNLKPAEAMQMTLFLASCLGLILAWRWPLIGGAMATSGMLLFFAVEFAMTGRFPKGLVFLLMLFSGAYFLLSGLLKRRLFTR